VVEAGVRGLKTLEAGASAVMEFVDGMTLAEWGLLIAVISLLVGIGALGYAKRAARVSEEELELAREQATLRPKLAVSLGQVAHQPRPENAGWPHDKVALSFDLTNGGRSAAHNVLCNISLDERHFALDDMHGGYSTYSTQHLGPSATEPVQVNVDVLHYGSTKAHYVCSCDEVGVSEGTIEFEVRERPQESEPSNSA
jgi:hypothetical protein